MAIPLLSLIPGVLKTIARVAGIDIFDKAADALKNLNLSPEKQLELQNSMQTHEAEMERLNIEAMKVAMQESLAMVASEDKFVKRARPFGLYSFYLASLALVAAQIAGAAIDPAAILTILAPLAGVGGTYIYKRTQEKLNGNGKE
jgi:hypothetical protein